ncbi:hypothetical protein JCM17960_23160 [Magnetospira thiophila]
MRLISGLTASIVVAMFLFGPLAGAMAQDAKQTTDETKFIIGVIDMEAVLRGALAKKNIDDQVAQLIKRLQEETAKDEEKLREADAELGRQRNIISAEAFEAKRVAFFKEREKAQRWLQAKQKAISDADQKAKDVFQEAMRKIIIDVANEKGISLVFRRRELVLTPKRLQIDDEVLAALNKSLPSVKVEVVWPVEP